MSRLSAFLILAFFGVCASRAVAVEYEPPALGRLFLTPDVRAKLESQRRFNVREARSIEGGSMRLDGVVVRSTGKSTVWINSQPQPENAEDTGVTARISRQQPGRATLVTGEEAPADLKVGVTINRATRETSGGLSAGEIRVHQSASPKP